MLRPADQPPLLLLHTLHNDETLIDRVFVIEESTRHDVKAVELALAERLRADGYAKCVPFIHFGLTSQDITSVALWLQIQQSRVLLISKMRAITGLLKDRFFTPYKKLPMLARTHGQPATPTTLGKEMMVFAERLTNQLSELDRTVCRTKFGGATGGFNAHYAAYPDVDWPEFADTFLSEVFNMKRQQFTTQIDHYDGMAQIFDSLKRCNTVLVDFCRDMWQYISIGYFLLKPVSATAVGSSTMPHKVNPIQFENAEGNLLMAIAVLEYLAAKLPVSRLQRDLTDSTATRNIGLAFGYTMLSLCKIVEGLETVSVDENAVRDDLSRHWEVITEGIQTVLRSHGCENAYDLLKTNVKEQVAQYGEVTEVGIRTFIATLDVSDAVKKRLHELSPLTYGPVLPP
jgi:adenylosuccinate lyase